MVVHTHQVTRATSHTTVVLIARVPRILNIAKFSVITDTTLPILFTGVAFKPLNIREIVIVKIFFAEVYI
jgi:hypothetical protein